VAQLLKPLDSTSGRIFACEPGLGHMVRRKF